MIPVFVDRDLGKRLARALQQVGVPTTAHIDRYPRANDETVPDTTWIAEAAGRGELILTRDGGIRRIDVEARAIVQAGARCVILETGNAKTFDYMRALMIAWPNIVRVLDRATPPYVLGLNRSGRLRVRYPETTLRELMRG